MKKNIYLLIAVCILFDSLSPFYRKTRNGFVQNVKARNGQK